MSSESVVFTVWGDTHEECVEAALKKLPELAGAGTYEIRRNDDLVLIGGSHLGAQQRVEPQERHAHRRQARLRRQLRAVRLSAMIEHHISDAQDAARELLEEIDRGVGARELAIVQTKLQEAEMWLRQSKDLRETVAAVELVEQHTTDCEKAGCLHRPFHETGTEAFPAYCALCRAVEAERLSPS